MNDDMSFCMDECKHTECERHPSNIVERRIPHSYMHFKGTEFCRQMTREEAIAYGREQLGVFSGLHREFIELAIRSLEAWDEVVKEIKGAGKIGKLTCIDIIKKHLKEVKDDKE